MCSCFKSTNIAKAKKFILANHFLGEPKDGDLELVEEDLPELKDGEILIEGVFWNVDVDLLLYSKTSPLGITIVGYQIGKITQSRAKDYPEGRYVFGCFGWRTHTVTDPRQVPFAVLLPNLWNVSHSLFLGVLGLSGNIAYFGLIDICKPKEGETVVVSRAADAVGNIVGQIAKIKGCRVVGLVDSDDKVKWVTEELGFDAAINYKNCYLDAALKEAVPNGADIYFDNGGGICSYLVLSHMKRRGRVAVCPYISADLANPANMPTPPMVQPFMVSKELVMEGFFLDRWVNRWVEGVYNNLKWIREKKMKYRETVIEGFENLPKAYVSELKGKHICKAIVKA